MRVLLYLFQLMGGRVLSQRLLWEDVVTGPTRRCQVVKGGSGKVTRYMRTIVIIENERGE